MAVDLTVQDQLDLMAASAAPTMVAADASGHTAINTAGGEVEIWVSNASASVLTMTIETARRSDFGSFPDKVISIPANKLVVLPTFSAKRFTDVGTGKVAFTVTPITSVTVAAVRAGQYFQEA